jgi:hypothetical protein
MSATWLIVCGIQLKMGSKVMLKSALGSSCVMVAEPAVEAG